MTMLKGVRVVECAERIAGPFCGRLLSRLGADVVKIERPGVGDPSRMQGPFRKDEANPEDSGLFAYLNAGKHSVEADVATNAGWLAVAQLIQGADLLIQDESEVAPQRAGRTAAELDGIAPKLVDLRIVAFGEPGPYAGYRAEALNFIHASGETSVLPGPGFAGGALERPPVQPGSPIAEYDAGWTAASAGLAGLFGAQASGSSVHVEVSKYESSVVLGRIRHVAWIEGVNLNRHSSRYVVGGTFSCADGYIQMLPSGARHWTAVLEHLGLERFLGDARFDFGVREISETASGELQEALADALATRAKDTVYHELAQAGVPAGVFSTIRDLFESPQLQHRQFFDEVPALGGPIAVPGLPFPHGGIEPGPPPRLGQHNDLIKSVKDEGS